MERVGENLAGGRDSGARWKRARHAVPVSRHTRLSRHSRVGGNPGKVSGNELDPRLRGDDVDRLGEHRCGWPQRWGAVEVGTARHTVPVSRHIRLSRHSRVGGNPGKVSGNELDPRLRGDDVEGGIYVSGRNSGVRWRRARHAVPLRTRCANVEGKGQSAPLSAANTH